jgi:uncharacterized membrane protein YuzA (DUF378 family)
MLNLINKICLPIAVVGAINYGLVVLGFDLLSLLNTGALKLAAQIIIGAAGAVVAFGLITNK